MSISRIPASLVRFMSLPVGSEVEHFARGDRPAHEIVNRVVFIIMVSAWMSVVRRTVLMAMVS